MNDSGELNFDPSAAWHIRTRIWASDFARFALYALGLRSITREHPLDMRVCAKVVDLVSAHEF